MRPSIGIGSGSPWARSTAAAAGAGWPGGVARAVTRNEKLPTVRRSSCDNSASRTALPLTIVWVRLARSRTYSPVSVEMTAA